MKPLPAPCDFKTYGSAEDPLRFIPSMDAMDGSTRALYEYLAIWWYELTGKIKK
jgi:hypothetical protein